MVDRGAKRVESNSEMVRVRVRIDGDEYSIRGRASRSYVLSLASIVDAQISRIRKGNPNLPRHQAAILAAINLADELQTLKKENQELFELLEDAR